MKLLQVITDTDRRGAQVFAVELGARLVERGHLVETVALIPGARGGLSVPTLGTRRFHPNTLRALRSRMGAADVTAAHGSSTLPVCAAASAGPGRPFVYRQISDPIFWTPSWLSRLRVAHYYGAAAHVVALSLSTRAIVNERFDVALDRISVVPNGVDERRCRSASAEDRQRVREHLGVDGPVLAYVGALVHEKGVADLLEAAPAGSTVLIAGGGVEQVALDRRAVGVPSNVRFLGTLRIRGWFTPPPICWFFPAGVATLNRPSSSRRPSSERRASAHR